MNPEFQTASGILGQALRLVRLVAAPWAGILALLTLPSRFASLYLLRRLSEFGIEAGDYGTYLRQLAAIILITHLIAAWARLRFAAACHQSYDGGETTTGLRVYVPFPAFLSYLLLYLTILLAELLTIPVIIFLPFFVTFHSLAAAIGYQLKGGVFFEAFNNWYRLLRPQRIFVALTAMLATISLCLLAALGFGYHFLVGTLDMLSGIDTTVLEYAGGQRPFYLFLLMFVSAVIEPIWIAAMVCHVRAHQLRESGDDLKLALTALRSSGT